MIVLGIDPGSHRCGYGVVVREGQRLRVLESGVLVPGDLPMPERLGLLLAGLDLTKTAIVKKAFEVIETDCLRGSELCRNMGLYSSRTGVNPEPVRLDELVDTVISLQNRFLLQDRISVTREIGEMPPLMAPSSTVLPLILAVTVVM